MYLCSESAPVSLQLLPHYATSVTFELKPNIINEMNCFASNEADEM